MRIMHFNQFGSHVGGAEGYIADVCSALRLTGHSSCLVYFSPHDAADLISDMHYAPLPEWPEPPTEAVRVIEQAIAAFRPDVAYIHAVYHPDLIQWIARRLPTAAYIHAPYPVCPGSAQYLHNGSQVCPHKAGLICLVNAQIERCCWGRNPLKHARLLRRVRAFVEAYSQVGVILVGSQFMRQLIQRAGMPSDRVKILPPVLFGEPFPPLKFAADSRTILFAGRLVPEKGLRHLLRALVDLKADWQLLVAGDGEERESCERLAAQLGLAQRIRFLGWVDGSQIHDCLESSACVVVPSLWPEPYGRLGPEAFLRGRPVVACAVGGIPDWLEHGMSGYLVPPGDTAQLGDSIRGLLESPDLRQQMGLHARQTASVAWDARIHVERLLSIFERVRAPGS